MTSAHQRKKQPEVIRRALLDQAARIAVEEGVAAVTVQAVAAAAGVTKGGLTHHFPSKQSLIEAMFQEMLDDLGRRIAELVAADPDPRGAFTRGYVVAVFEITPEDRGGPWAALSVLMLSDPSLRAMWSDWFQARLEEAGAGDAGLDLAIVRLAADGIWLADLSGTPLPDRAALSARLIAATRG